MVYTMYLTREEEAILSGKHGPEYQKAMKALVKLGDALGAEKLVKVVHAHISGISYQNIGDAGLDFLEEYSKVKVRTYTTCNPLGFDMDLWKEMGIPEEFYAKQLRIVGALKRMGVNGTFTCTPYYIRKPLIGEHLAWGESNAVLYANSVCGARTNREGGPSTVFAALVGKVPYMGVHVDENRTPQVLIKVNAPLKDQLYAGVLGYIVGTYVKDKVPLIRNIGRISDDMVKALCAGLGTSSSTPLCFLENISPEIPKMKLKYSELEKIEIDAQSLNDVIEAYGTPNSADAIFLGCPHFSYGEIMEIYRYISKYNRKAKTPIVLVTSRRVFKEVSLHVKLLFERRNVRLIRDTCFAVSPFKYLGMRKVLTNSIKQAYYLSNIHGVKVGLCETKKCIEVAFEEK
ncbi:MAG: hypothetical protein B6U75_02490 [Desulfurococcales archaeon ex4484_217_1]|nr:MAG: hypothetical protein B6U75_02490 [Desulfurococcales archaeon ex4484_217_1]